MQDILQLLDEPDTTIALVGATDNPSKYGHTIYLDLKRKGYTVLPVNPQRVTVDADEAYEKLADLPEPPTIVNFVIPPRFTLHVLKQCLELGLKNVWLQPGAESPEVMEFIQEHDFNYLANACIMVQSRLKV
ncbi:MAG: CoA-binding protein [Acidimicrobiia bacterium]|nr:CoA-binding protein [Acidimicrobiia bacterium]MBT8194512.1 CoA-binding protein [Acidimicrobiia bacterium]MBT8248496.1 CoA-binding protein [Acidimicrobiia bacterium]NNF87443.1 CoA-binding protein [Acidimicrobiia bacterium]NNJ48021.1 CoA-binding protein [Acidimicrobiia bacterium]